MYVPGGLGILLMSIYSVDIHQSLLTYLHKDVNWSIFATGGKKEQIVRP